MFGFLGAYIWYPLYDNLAHLVGSAVLAFIGFSIIYSLNYSGRIKVTLPMMGIFTFLWTMALGAVWEIFEFIWDNLVVFIWGELVEFSQEYGFAQNSLMETMIDLSLDGLAGVCVALSCVFLVRHVNKRMFEGLFRPFVKMIEHKPS